MPILRLATTIVIACLLSACGAPSKPATRQPPTDLVSTDIAGISCGDWTSLSPGQRAAKAGVLLSRARDLDSRGEKFSAKGWKVRPAGLSSPSVDGAVAALKPGTAVTQYVCVPVGHWTALLSNGPLGTDVGILPSYAARELGCRAIRVVNLDDTATFPARILEVYGPQGMPRLALERSIVAANDGGRWVFGASGEPYPFEELAAYSQGRKAKRFTSDMVYDYLRGLGVPVGSAPDWSVALMVEQA